MSIGIKRIVLCGLATLWGFPAYAQSTSVVGSPGANAPILKSGDTLAIVGGTLVERMQATAALEDQLLCRRPDWKIRVRNLGWSGDDVHGFARKVFETDAKKGLERLFSDLEIVNPSVVLIAYGFAEASNGARAVERFEPGLRLLIDRLRTPNRRVVLLRPFEMPGVKVSGYAASMLRCREIVANVGREFSVPVLDVKCDSWTNDGMAPSATGYAEIGGQLADALVGGQSCDVPKEVGELILEKNELFFHRHRPQNETYLLLFRKHEQGNNAVELPQFDSLIDSMEQQIWGLTSATR